MRILSVRRGFLADHSSTSYEFLAVDRPLDAKARAAVVRLSRRARPTSRRVSFVYHAEGYDLPGGWEPLMARYYDVMHSESYDWWTLVVAFDTDDKQFLAKLKKYVFTGSDDLGVSVSGRAGRIVVTISCRLSADAQSEPDDSWEDEPDEEEGDGDDRSLVTDDGLLGLLVKVRACLMKGDFQPLYAVWSAYGSADDEDAAEDVPAPPKPRKTKAGAAVAAELAGLLTSA
jgi:hypothetical protein